MDICLVGAGRIGEVHSKNINDNKKTNLKYVVDINFIAAKKIAAWLKNNPRILNTISACVLLIIAVYVALTENY